jgi:hypothetical protein
MECGTQFRFGLIAHGLHRSHAIFSQKQTEGTEVKVNYSLLPSLPSVQIFSACLATVIDRRYIIGCAET